MNNADKKEKAIVLGITGNLAFAVANVFMGIKKYSPDINADFIVFYQDLSEKDKELLCSIIKCKFIEYSFPETKELEDAIKRYSQLSFCRYEMFKMLDEYKKLLWLDSDILIQKDISGVFDYAKTGISLMPEKTTLDECFYEDIQLENINMNVKNHNSGVLLISDILPNYQNATDWLYNRTFQLADKLKFVDQGILNLMVQELDFQIDKLPEEYNCHPTLEAAKNAAIVHAYAPQKFWKWWDFDYHFREWDKNYKQWLKMGGSPYTGESHDIIDRWAKRIHHNCPHPLRRPTKFLKFILKNTM